MKGNIIKLEAGHNKIEKYNEYSAERGAEKLTRALMKGGKIKKAERLVRRASALIKMHGAKVSIKKAIGNVQPLIEIRGKAKKGRRGKQKQGKAVPVLKGRGEKLAIEWIIQGAKRRKESERSMALSLYYELYNAYQNKGYAIGKRKEMHDLCRINIKKR